MRAKVAFPGADPRRQIPASDSQRLDQLDATLVSLAREELRLERLGLELPLARCHQQRRYWAFLHALYSIPGATLAPGPHAGESSWRSRPRI